MRIEILSEGIVTTTEYDAVATAGNCTGAMLGGLDSAFARELGHDVVVSVQKFIEASGGSVPVGKAFAVPTGRKAPAWLVYAPTMERPMNVQGTRNAGYAAFAACCAAQYVGARSLALPLFCTGYGKMPVDAARVQIEESVALFRVLTRGGLGFHIFPKVA